MTTQITVWTKTAYSLCREDFATFIEGWQYYGGVLEGAMIMGDLYQIFSKTWKHGNVHVHMTRFHNGTTVYFRF